MINLIKNFFLVLAAVSIFMTPACTDDIDFSEPAPAEKDGYDLSDVPTDILDGYSLSFNMSVLSIDGGNPSLTSRATTNQELRDIENFVDLEKLRILFFTCLDDNDYTDEFGEKRGPEDPSQNIVFHTGQHDVFLFEAKSRWVSLLSTAEASDASYQVTSPVFEYGNNESYDWEYIREALCTRPFKIVILANRPESIRYSDLDTNYSSSESQDVEFYFDNTGPYWGVEESEAGKQSYMFLRDQVLTESQENNRFRNVDQKDGYPKLGTTINELHHCQWDPVYGNKNSTSGYNWYDFIIKNRTGKVPNMSNVNVETWRANGEPDAMGAISAWTTWLRGADGKWITSGGKNKNFYVLPDPNQAIPMYGVQKFNALGEWKQGTPIHLSAVKAGESSSIQKKNISLLRSLARVELLIPKSLGLKVKQVSFKYSNVFGRCEPMDVATPTNQIWDDSSNHSGCEWNNIYKYGPIIYDETTAESESNFLNRMAWFYGAWKPWWNFREKLSATDAKFDNQAKTRNNNNRMPYPRIFNTCIQRNGDAYLDYVQTSDDEDDYYHYVVYTGERNINDPSKFSNSGKGLYVSASEVAHFQIEFDNVGSYMLFINPYNSGSAANNYLSPTTIGNPIRTAMSGPGTTQNDWNWPIMRNHAYVFRVKSVGSATDNDGLNVIVISSENRTAPPIDFY